MLLYYLYFYLFYLFNSAKYLNSFNYLNSAKMADLSKPIEKESKEMFSVNDLVLCYEPDPLKARVLYEAKVKFCLECCCSAVIVGF